MNEDNMNTECQAEFAKKYAMGYCPTEMARLGKLDVVLRKAQKLVREAYRTVLDAKSEYGPGLEFNVTVGWDNPASLVF